MTVSILEGHVIDVLNALPAKHWHLCVCSPPYWQLRAYGTPPQTWPDGWVGELGQEESVERYLDHLLDCMEAVRRVLRDDGSCWVNLAGCYFSNPGGQNGAAGNVSARAQEANRQQGRVDRTGQASREGYWLKPLDYVDVPGLFAHRMQAAGWIWRNTFALVKRSPLPESVRGWCWERCRVKVAPGKTTRRGTAPKPTSAGYASHGESIFDDGGCYGSMTAQWADCPGCPKCSPNDGLVLRRGNGRATRAWESLLVFIKRPGAYWDTEGTRSPLSRAPEAAEFGRKEPAAYGKDHLTGNMQPGVTWTPNPAGANLRDWLTWEVETLKESHYAAFPPFIPRLAISAGTSERGCCPTCGAPHARILDRGAPIPDPQCWSSKGQGQYDDSIGAIVSRSPADGSTLKHIVPTTTLGWRQTCACPAHEPVPCRVLDCFSGAGTTVLVADRLGRDGVGVELKPTYVEMSRRRVTQDAPLLVEWTGQEAGTHHQLSMLDMTTEAAGEG